jgi:outer membrane lipoprotein-sorting protein
MKHTLLLLLLALGTLMQAQKNEFTPVTNSKEVEAQLMKASSQIKTISCDFVQKKHLEALDAIIESKGKFWYKAPGQLRWEYTNPFSYLIVLSNGMFTVKDGAKKSEFDLKKNRAFKELNDIIVSSVNGTLIESKKFNIAIRENATHYLVALEPILPEMKSVLMSIELYFSKKDMNVEKTRMIESKNDYTEILFTNRIHNSVIAPEVFNIK